MEKAILEQLKGKTRIIITHAIQYIKYADRVLIMEKGKIVKQGTYEQVQDTPSKTRSAMGSPKGRTREERHGPWKVEKTQNWRERERRTRRQG